MVWSAFSNIVSADLTTIKHAGENPCPGQTVKVNPEIHDVSNIGIKTLRLIMWSVDSLIYCIHYAYTLEAKLRGRHSTASSLTLIFQT